MAPGHQQGFPSQAAGEIGRLKGWLENPQKLLRLLGATAAAHAGPLHRESVQVRLNEDDVVGFVRLLAHVALASRQVRDEVEAAGLNEFFRQRLYGLPSDLVVALERILGQLPVPAPAGAPLPLQLSARLIHSLAAEAYHRGEVSPGEAHGLLHRLSEEIGTLRRSLGWPGLGGDESQLQEEFWSSLPEPDRRRLLTSEEAWCVPASVVRRTVEARGTEPEQAHAILEQYALCAHHPEEAARASAARGLTELADLYGYFGEPLLESALAQAGRQLARESRPALHSLFANAFIRLGQQAANRRGYRALQQALEALRALERTQPLRGEELRSRVAVENRLPDFIREVLQAPALSADFLGLLRQAPEAAAEELNRAFETCYRRAEMDRLVELAAGLGTPGIDRLREKLRSEPPPAAVSSVGLLSRLEPDVLYQLLPARLARWSREYHDAVVRGLAAGGSPERGRLLLQLLSHFDPLVLPAALDEIGLSGDRETAPRLMRLAGGTLLQSSEPYLRVKALEALGRLRDPAAAPLLRHLVEAKRVWRWSEPREIRIAAAQALQKIDPDWARRFIKRSGLSPEELAVTPLDPQPDAPWVRQRRYLRIPLTSDLPVVVHTPRLPSGWPLVSRVLSLGGGLAESQNGLPAGAEVEIELRAGLRPVRATALLRDPRPPRVGFEILSIDLGDRFRLRRLLVPHWQQMARAGLSPA